jgi:putative oxidoreductase
MKKIFSTKYSDFSIAVGLFVIRLAVGGLMIPHGFSKLEKFAQRAGTFSDPFGIGSSLSLSLVIFAEFFCAILIVIGLVTRFAIIPLIIAMAVAVFYSNKGNLTGGGETASLFLAGFIALLFMGPGKISVDRLIGR